MNDLLTFPVSARAATATWFPWRWVLPTSWRKPSTAPTLYVKKGVITLVSVSGLFKAIKRVLTLGRAK